MFSVASSYDCKAGIKTGRFFLVPGLRYRVFSCHIVFIVDTAKLEKHSLRPQRAVSVTPLNSVVYQLHKRDGKNGEEELSALVFTDLLLIILFPI